MFDIMRRWVTLADPVRFAGWCGEPRTPVLNKRLTHFGGTDEDLKVVEFCDEVFGTRLAGILHRRCQRHKMDYMEGHGDKSEYIVESNAAFADACEVACRTLRQHEITVVDEFGCPLLDEE